MKITAVEIINLIGGLNSRMERTKETEVNLKTK